MHSSLRGLLAVALLATLACPSPNADTALPADTAQGLKPPAADTHPGSGTPPAEPTPTREAALTYHLPAPMAKFLDGSDSIRTPRNLGGWGTPPTRFAFATWHPDPRGFQVNRLTVVDLVGDAAVVRSSAGELSDPRWSEVRVFLDGARTLILGEAEDEYSLGIQAFDVDSTGRLTDLKLPWVALPDTEGTMGPSADALPDASVAILEGRWVISFEKDLIVDPGSEDQHLLCRIDPAHPIALVRSTSGWEIKNGEQQDAGPPMGPLRTCSKR